MITFSINELYIIIIALLILLVFRHGDVKYLKGRIKELEKIDTNNGWRSEALFHRHQLNIESAEFAEYN